jgi:hypothetical protein
VLRATLTPMQKILLIALLAGCSTSKVEPQDSFEDLAAAKADSFSGKMRVAGNLAYGDAALRIKYSSTPIYRAVTFTASSGDPVDVWVRSTQGDPVTWILDSSYKVVSKNDDASANVTDSHLSVTLKKAGTFYVVFRDYSYESHYFNVELKGPSGGCALKLSSGGSNAGIDELGQTFDDKNAGWTLTTRTLPGCADLRDAGTRERLRSLLQTGGFLDSTPVQVSAVAPGGNHFAQLLDRALDSLHDRSGADARADSLEGGIKRPVLSTPDAYLEISLSTDAEECSQVGDALIDTRTGIVYLITQLLPC